MNQPVQQSAIESAFDNLAAAIRRASEGQQFLENRVRYVTVPWGMAPKHDSTEAAQRQKCQLEESILAASTLIHEIADRQETLGKAIQL